MKIRNNREHNIEKRGRKGHMRNKKRYVVFTMVLLLVISISFACRYLMIQEYSQIMDKNETQLSDYAGSTWYSEQTGCMLEDSH